MSLSDENVKKLKAAIDALENILTDLVPVPADFRGTDALEIAMSLFEQQIEERSEFNIEPPTESDTSDVPLDIVESEEDNQLEMFPMEEMHIPSLDMPPETIQNDIFNDASFLFLTKEDMGGVPGADDLQNWYDSSPDK